MGNAIFGPSKAEREKRAAELRKNVTMSEHLDEVEDLLTKLETDAAKVFLSFHLRLDVVPLVGIVGCDGGGTLRTIRKE